MKLPISWRAIIYGVISFVGVYLGYIFLANVLAPSDAEVMPDWLGLPLTIVGWGLYVVPGYVAGRVAGVRGLLHGFLTGLIAGSSLVLLSQGMLGTYEEGLLGNVSAVAAWAAFIGALSGGVGQLHAIQITME